MENAQAQHNQGLALLLGGIAILVAAVLLNQLLGPLGWLGTATAMFASSMLVYVVIGRQSGVSLLRWTILFALVSLVGSYVDIRLR